MNSKFHQNAILTGCIDCFCLVCESHLRSEHDVASHIEKPVHLKNLSSCPYMEKFSDDHIRKVKKGYYCEFCNLLCPTAAKVGLHITESTHNNNKGEQLIKRNGNNILILDNFLITEQAWNGLIMDTCAVCNMEFKNLKLHIADQTHVLNLIQKKVEFGNGSTVYRKIDDASFHCLICNTIFAMNTVSSHYNDAIHETHVDKCRKSYQASFENNKNVESVNGLQNGKNDCIKTHIENHTMSNVKVKDHEVNNANEKANSENTKQKSKAVVKNSTGTDNTTCKRTSTKNNNQDDVIAGKTKSDANEKKITSTQTEKPKLISQNVNDANTGTDTYSLACGCKITNTKNINNNKHNDLIGVKTKSGQNEKKTKATQSESAKFVIQDANETKIGVKDIKTTEKVDKGALFEHVSEFQKNGININFENETAFCKKCFKSVDLDIAVIKLHIKEHVNNVKKEVTANTSHTLNQKHSKTVLNSKEKDETDRKPTVNFDQNHNITKNKTQETTEEKEEEIIKLDLRKNSEEEFEESETNNAIMRYVPIASAAEPQKPQEPASQSTNKGPRNTNEPETFAKQNNITYNYGNGNAFCRICNKRIPAAFQNMKEHVAGMQHKSRLARIAQEERAAKFIPKKPMIKFIDICSTVKNVFGVDDVILNDKYCLTRMSFFMITTQNRLRCQACEVTLTEGEVSRHVDGVFHERAMERTPVVTSLPGEFIREVRKDLYHCGFCNLIVGPWEDVQFHLQCSEHDAQARKATSRLQSHLPEILEHRAARRLRMHMSFFENFWPFF